MSRIDMHSHILPGLDDGARDERESLEMFRLAAEDGITGIIATPHFHYRKGHAAPEEIKTLVAQMQEKLKHAEIPIELYSGNELYYTQELLQSVKNKEALTLADSDYVLLEFSPESGKRCIHNAVYEFLSEGYCPVIAHVERYEAFLKHPDFAEEILQMGAYFQINAGSLSGNTGWNMKRFTRMMVEAGLVHLIATDAHDTKKRSPVFGKSAEWIRKKCGKSQEMQYLWENPRLIIENKSI